MPSFIWVNGAEIPSRISLSVTPRTGRARLHREQPRFVTNPRRSVVIRRRSGDRVSLRRDSIVSSGVGASISELAPRITMSDVTRRRASERPTSSRCSMVLPWRGRSRRARSRCQSCQPSGFWEQLLHRLRGPRPTLLCSGCAGLSPAAGLVRGAPLAGSVAANRVCSGHQNRKLKSATMDCTGGGPPFVYHALPPSSHFCILGISLSGRSV
jgi:hypothetical protein